MALGGYRRRRPIRVHPGVNVRETTLAETLVYASMALERQVAVASVRHVCVGLPRLRRLDAPPVQFAQAPGPVVRHVGMEFARLDRRHVADGLLDGYKFRVRIERRDEQLVGSEAAS